MQSIVSLLLLASANTGQSDHWQLMSSYPDYGPIEMEFAAQSDQSAYRFTIEPKPDGSLPMVQTNVGNYIHNLPSPLYIVKKRPSGKYALFAALHSRYFRSSETSGLLLTPGDYGYIFNPPSPPYIPRQGLALLSGRWVSGAEQNNLWSFVSTNIPTVFPLTGGGSGIGYKFSVEARSDGKIPAWEQCTAQVNSTPSIFELYRLNTAGTYDFLMRLDLNNGTPATIATLPPAGYAITSSDGTNWNYTRRYATVLTGRYVDP